MTVLIIMRLTTITICLTDVRVNMTQSNSDNTSNRAVQNDLIDKRKIETVKQFKMRCSERVKNGLILQRIQQRLLQRVQQRLTLLVRFLLNPTTLLKKLILDYFNKVTNSKYREGKTTTGHIKARLAEGFTSEDLILITDYPDS